jgi:hypothetical protein
LDFFQIFEICWQNVVFGDFIKIFKKMSYCNHNHPKNTKLSNYYIQNRFSCHNCNVWAFFECVWPLLGTWETDKPVAKCGLWYEKNGPKIYRYLHDIRRISQFFCENALKTFIGAEKNFWETKIKKKCIFFTFCTQGGVTLIWKMTHFTWSSWKSFYNTHDLIATIFLLFWVILYLFQSHKPFQGSKKYFWPN